jgi:Uma2 family endonuclease
MEAHRTSTRWTYAFAEGDYLEPDLVFVARDREALLSDRGIEGPPDLVVEVVSPSTEARDRGLKLDRYRHFGVGEYCAPVERVFG